MRYLQVCSVPVRAWGQTGFLACSDVISFDNRNSYIVQGDIDKRASENDNDAFPISVWR